MIIFTYLKAAHIVLTPRRLATNTYTLGEGEGNTKVTKPTTPTKAATPAPRDRRLSLSLFFVVGAGVYYEKFFKKNSM